MNDTTRPGVSEGEPGEGAQAGAMPPKMGRAEVLARAAENRRKQLGMAAEAPPEGEEGEEFLGDEEPPLEPPARKAQAGAEGEPPPADAGEKPPASAQPAPVYLKDGVWMTKVKVDGVEREVPFESVQRNAQKLSAGDERLRLAAQKERELADRERRLGQQRQTQQPPAKPDPKLAEQRRGLRQKLATALADGDDDQAARLWDQIDDIDNRMRPQVAPVDINSLADQVSDQVDQKSWVRKVSAAKNAFFSNPDNEDIVDSVKATRAVDALTSEILAEHPGWEPGAIIDEAAKRYRESRRADGATNGSPGGRTATPTNNGARVQAKRAASGVVPTGGSQRHTAPPPPPAPTRADAVAAMRKARGLPPL